MITNNEEKRAPQKRRVEPATGSSSGNPFSLFLWEAGLVMAGCLVVTILCDLVALWSS